MLPSCPSDNKVKLQFCGHGVESFVGERATWEKITSCSVFKEEIERAARVEHGTVVRLYYIDITIQDNIHDHKNVVVLDCDDGLLRMWKAFDQMEKMVIHVESQRIFIERRLQGCDYSEIEPLASGERSFLFKVRTKGKTMVAKITVDYSLKDSIREVNKVLDIEHPNIIRAHQILNFQDSFGTIYSGYLMDYYHRGDLSKIQLTHELSLIIIGMKMAQTFFHLKEQKLLHRDIKAGNFFIRNITKRGDIKIYDLILGDFEYCATVDSVLYLSGIGGRSSTDSYESEVHLIGETLLSMSLKDKSNVDRSNITIDQTICSQKLFDFIKRMMHPTKEERPNISDVSITLTEMAVTKKSWALEYAEESLRNDEVFMEKMVDVHTSTFRYAHEELRSNEKFVRKVLQKDTLLFKHVGATFKKNYDFTEEYVKKNGLLIDYVAPEFKDKLMVWAEWFGNFDIELAEETDSANDNKHIEHRNDEAQTSPTSPQYNKPTHTMVNQ